MMFSNKKGQGMSLNVIIIAALALIVLVVLTVIFTSKAAIFSEQVSEKSRTELIEMKISYGDCHPTVRQEGEFTSAFDKAESVDDKESAKVSFRDEISRCNGSLDRADCESQDCAWE